MCSLFVRLAFHFGFRSFPFVSSFATFPFYYPLPVRLVFSISFFTFTHPLLYSSTFSDFSLIKFIFPPFIFPFPELFANIIIRYSPKLWIVHIHRREGPSMFRGIGLSINFTQKMWWHVLFLLSYPDWFESSRLFCRTNKGVGLRGDTLSETRERSLAAILIFMRWKNPPT